MNHAFLNRSYNRDEFINFAKEFLPDFGYEESSVRISHNSLFNSAQTLGSALGGELAILEIAADSTSVGRRIAITKEAFKILRDHGMSNALVAFDDGHGKWRLSLLTTSLKLNDAGKVISEASNPRRYSYLLGVGAKTVTPYKYLIEKGKVEDIKQLQERFSVEVVNKQFYASIADLFTKLVGGKRGATEYPGLLKIRGVVNQNVEHQEFAVRLIGRIIFGWFLKEKKSPAGIPIVPNELLSLDAVASNADYYHSMLEPLFFELLNKRVELRHESLREAPFSTVPYLNGGLFSPQDNDFYNQNSFNGAGTPVLTHIHDSWFTELFTVLEQYNFTVDENTSYDVDLSIDPEMLGRIFENLLAEINPETGESARKSTGSFYTPREIVDYMVDSSLLEFLKGKTSVSEDKLKALISWDRDDDDEHPLTETEKKNIVDALATLTILDPACGSGAFPIGILQKVVYILQQVDEKAEIWLENQLKYVTAPELRKDIEEKYQNENYDWLRKLGVIRESIFGVDIQTIATEIAKLRCFLTLVIEEEVDDNKDNRGIRPLPNLDFKFVTANSLVPLPQEANKGQGALFEDINHIDELKKIRDEYFTANVEERQSLRNRFDSLQKKMFMKTLDEFKGQSSARYSALSRWEPFENNPTEWFDAEWMFGLDGFDIVIANPPYIHLESMKDLAAKLYRPLNFATYEARGDIYSLFYEKGIESLKKGGVLTFITSNKWMRAGYGGSLRDFFVNNANPLSLVDLGGGVFESATVDTSILVLRKEPYTGETKAVATSKNFSVKDMSDYIRHNTVTMNFKAGESWAILSPIEQSIKAKIEAVGTPLKNWDIKINRGILTGLNEAFIIDRLTRDRLIAQDAKSAEIIRPILRGKDIKRNSYVFNDQYVILAHFGSHKFIPTKYPAIYEWLKRFEEKLKKRGQCRYRANGKPNLNAEYPGQHHWLELDNNPRQEYMDDFNHQKIVWADIAKEPTFVTIDEPIFFNNTCYMIVGAPSGLTDILNSKMIEWYFPKIATDIGNGGARYFKQFVELIRVPEMIENRKYSDHDIFRLYGLNADEIAHISSLVD